MSGKERVSEGIVSMGMDLCEVIITAAEIAGQSGIEE